MRFLGRYFARAVVRRLSYIVAAAVVGLVLQTCSFSASAMDQGEAYGACMRRGDVVKTTMYPGATIKCEDANGFRCYFSHASSGGAFVACPTPWYFPYSDSCSSRNSRFPPGDAGLGYSAPNTCIGGCRLLGTPITNQTGGVKIYGLKDRYYSGDVCTMASGPNGISPEPPPKESEPSDKPKPDECVALGSGQTSCSKPNGDHCATASTGKTFCWKPGQEGSQADGPEGQRKSEQGKPVAPPDQPPPPDKDWQRSEGHQSEVCQGSSCKTYNLTNYTSVPAGSAKNSSGDNSADGTKNTSGNGKPGAGSGGDGDSKDGDSASDSGNCDQAPACTGDTLKCLHLKFTWKIQCNTKGSEISRGDGCGDGDVPVCAGSSCKAEAYAQLLQQWRGRCSVENVLKGIEQQAGQGDGGDGKVGIIVEDSGNGLALDEGKVSYGSGKLGYSFDVEGVKFEMPQQLLDFLPILRMLIIAAASLAAIGIIRGNG